MEGKYSVMNKHERIPGESAWHGYESDFEVSYMHERFYGKSNADVQKYFGGGRSIERAEELRRAPRPVFQYYVQAFASFVRSKQAAGDSDSASTFLGLLKTREELDPGSVKEIYTSLAECVDFIAGHQDYFDADVDIYGDFRERAKAIREACCS